MELELLEMLRQCAHELLLAYDDTLSPVFMEAFEKTADACEVFYCRIKPESTPLFH
jgi:hypothetical protein